jgi:hypothetical protein
VLTGSSRSQETLSSVLNGISQLNSMETEESWVLLSCFGTGAKEVYGLSELLCKELINPRSSQKFVTAIYEYLYHGLGI